MNRVLGIGTDIVYIPRFRELLLKYGDSPTFNRITSKFMNMEEQRHLYGLYKVNKPNSLNSSARYMAGIWAAKESSYKALSCFIPFDELPPARVIYSGLLRKNNESNGRPIITYSNKFESQFPEYSEVYNKYIGNKVSFLTSISHDTDYLVSFVCINTI